ncbi:MAG: hypothetical protein M1814_004221 [Vezdaea aestivalis]|nr:MAG: hypothetical protein M1814_004221 [Vezdaea aestivalis]
MKSQEAQRSTDSNLADVADIEKHDDAPAPAPQRGLTGIKFFLVVISTLSSIFLYALDNTIVADLIPIIVNDFQSVDQIGWLSVGFMIGGVAVIMPFGKLYGLFNAKWLYIASLILFEASSALCGGAPNMTAMIVGRVFAGAGGIGMYLGVLTLISVNTLDHERPTYLSLIGLVWGLGTVLGPVVGGAFAKVNWRWSFYINLIIGAVFAPVYLFMIPPFDPAAGTAFGKRVVKIDIVGAIISIGAMVSLIMAMNFGGTLYAWNSGQVIALFVVSGILFIAFAVQQGFSFLTAAANRMFPVHFLRNKEALLLFICAAAINSSTFITIYFIPIYFQFTRGDDALQSAVRLLPLIFLLSFTILSNGFLMSKLGYYQPWYIVGSAIALVAGVLFSRITTTTSTSAIYGFEVLLGVGAGAFIQAGYAVIQTVTEYADLYYAIAFMMIAQIGGIALGLSISSAVFVNLAKNRLVALLPGIPASQIQQAISGTSSTFFETLSATDRANALTAIIESMQKVFIPVYVGGAVALVTSAFLNRKRAFLPVGAAA